MNKRGSIASILTKWESYGQPFYQSEYGAYSERGQRKHKGKSWPVSYHLPITDVSGHNNDHCTCTVVVKGKFHLHTVDTLHHFF